MIAAPVAGPPRLEGANLAAIQAQDPNAYALPLRVATAERCQRESKRRFAQLRDLRDAGKDAAAKNLEAEARDWMRERRRWIGESAS